MLSLLLILPFFGFVSGSLFGRFFGSKGISFISTTCVFFSFFISFFYFCEIISTGNVYILIFDTWIQIENLNVNWGICLDSLTVIMLIVITFISFLVHLYSTEYMVNDPHLPRFLSYLSLFTFFMLILVVANNFLQMFVGWEGVGVSSYLLINFWFTRIQANKAAIKAMLINRIGDFALLLAIFGIFFIFNSLDYDIIFSLAPLIIDYRIIISSFEIPVLDFICIFLFFGAMGKSAQLGLHTWLPDAMEGPTPVSALIHAATMVTAGVFLIARSSYFFEFSLFSLNLITKIGASTAFFAATTGLFQNDIKKVIAYSTCSQLGYMIFACGLSSYDVGLFHLSNHAFFKALLFLGAGSVIHATYDEQDMRKLGGLKNVLSFSYAVMLIGSLALIGFPFLAGFFSKDVILEISLAKFSISGNFAFILGLLAAFCTAFYSTKLIYFIFLSNPNGVKLNIFNAHESTWRMTFPLLILTILSVLIGFFSKDLFIGFGTNFWGYALFIKPTNYILCESEFIDYKYKCLPLLAILLGTVFSFFLYYNNIWNFFVLKKTFLFKNIYIFFNKKWFFDRIYHEIFTQKFLNLGYFFSYRILDRGIIESIGPQGLINTIFFFLNTITFFEIESIKKDLHLLFLSIILILFLIFKTSLFIILPIFLCLEFYFSKQI